MRCVNLQGTILLMFLGNLEEMDLIYPWSIVIIHCLE